MPTAVRTFIDDVKSQIAISIVVVSLSLVGGACAAWINLHDLRNEHALDHAQIQSIQADNKVLSQQVVDLRITAAQLTTVVSELTAELQSLRNDLRK